MPIERNIREILEQGQSSLLEADMSRRLDMLVRQGLMPAGKLPLLKRGLEKMNMGKVGSPQERESVNSLLNSLMYIVLGDDTVFQRARQHTQKSRYQAEESETEAAIEEEMDMCNCDCECDGNICETCGLMKPVLECKDEDDFKPHMMYDPKTGKGYMAKVYKDHVRMDKMGYTHDKPEVKEERATANHADKIEKHLGKNYIAQVEDGGHISVIHKNAKSAERAHEIHVHGGHAKVVHTETGETKGKVEYKGVQHLDNLSKLAKKHDSHLKEELTDFRHKQQDSTELNGDGNRDRGRYGEDLTGDKEMFQFQPGNPFAKAKKEMQEGAYKRMATDDQEDARMKAQKKAARLSKKMAKQETETDPGIKEAEEKEYKVKISGGKYRPGSTETMTVKGKSPEHAIAQAKKGHMNREKGEFSIHEDTIEEKFEELLEKNVPTNPKLWSKFKAQAKAKFDVYPSAYANGWAAKQYKKAGGSWRSESVEFDELTDQLVEYGMMSSDKASHNTGGFRISNKDAAAAKTRLKAKSAVKTKPAAKPMAEEEELEEGVAPNTLDIYQAHKDAKKAGKTDGSSMNKLAKKNTLIANPKTQRVRKVTKDRAKFAVKKGFVYAEEWTDEELDALFEMDYKAKFNAMLKKTGKSLAQMSADEKKKFFNSVDAAHTAQNEEMQTTGPGVKMGKPMKGVAGKTQKVGGKLSHPPRKPNRLKPDPMFAKNEELDLEEASAVADAKRDYAKDDKKGLAPLKKDKPAKVSDASNAKEIEHIVPQLRKAITVGKEVQFQDGKTHKIAKHHAAKFMKKYMDSKPAQKAEMQSSAHKSHDHFMKHV